MLPAWIATHIMMMIAMKIGVMMIVVGATMIANAVIMINQRDQGLHSHIAADWKNPSTM